MLNNNNSNMHGFRNLQRNICSLFHSREFQELYFTCVECNHIPIEVKVDNLHIICKLYFHSRLRSSLQVIHKTIELEVWKINLHSSFSCVMQSQKHFQVLYP
jgi:hypothetical protein